MHHHAWIIWYALAALCVSLSPVSARTLLTGTTFIYVYETCAGEVPCSDSNDGLTKGTALRTIDAAIQRRTRDLDFGGQIVVVQVGCGSSWGPVNVRGSHVGAGEFKIAADSTCATKPVISQTTSVNSYGNRASFAVQEGAYVTVLGFDFTSPDGTDFLVNDAVVYLYDFEMKQAAWEQISIVNGGKLYIHGGRCDFSGGGQSAISLKEARLGLYVAPNSCRFLNTPQYRIPQGGNTYSPGDVLSLALGSVFAAHNCPFTGSAEGRRFQMKGSYSMWYDDNLNCVPGNSAGAFSEGGRYGGITQ